MPLLFVCFALSGFAGLLYQTVWMRVAMAKFGVNTCIIATVIAVFMLGLAAGTWLAGRYAGRIERRLGLRRLQLYAMIEFIIAIGGAVVPYLMDGARRCLLGMGASNEFGYTLSSAILLTAILFPFCAAMGFTFPVALSYLRRQDEHEAEDPRTFSFLYMANVLGAIAGVLIPTIALIELFGFRSTLHIGVAANLMAAVLALRYAKPDCEKAGGDKSPISIEGTGGFTTAQAALFWTGFSSMGMEVVWTRLFTPFTGTFVYAFAGILAVYLVSTFAGTWTYRWARRLGHLHSPWPAWPWIALASLLPLGFASVRLGIHPVIRLTLGLGPLCALLGWVTPHLLDMDGKGDPRQSARAYGWNLIGCVIGPLAAGYLLLPLLGPRISLLVLVLPLFAFIIAAPVRRETKGASWGIAVLTAGFIMATSVTFDDQVPPGQVRNDPTATVVAAGEGMNKRLFVNGVGITHLTPITKMMAHFPMSIRRDSADTGTRALVICMGMGTSFRSLVSWGIDVTTVELVPSVPKFFSYYFADADTILRRGARVVIDDGRRFLDRSPESFDLITIDPPPPVEAAVSGLLYSREFYESARRRLRPGGILHTWLPNGDASVISSAVKALMAVFGDVRIYRSMEGWGLHLIAAERLPEIPDAETLTARMPDAARADMVEWGAIPPVEYHRRVLAGQIDAEAFLAHFDRTGEIPILSDDRPINEFFLLRRYILRPHGPAPKPSEI